MLGLQPGGDHLCLEVTPSCATPYAICNVAEREPTEWTMFESAQRHQEMNTFFVQYTYHCQ